MVAGFLFNYYQGVNLQKFYDNPNMPSMSPRRQEESLKLTHNTGGYSHLYQSYPPLPERGLSFQEAKL